VTRPASALAGYEKAKIILILIALSALSIYPRARYRAAAPPHGVILCVKVTFDKLVDMPSVTGLLGSASQYDGADLVQESNNQVVAVVVQYRLGLFGKHSFGTSERDLIFTRISQFS
jgi:hypothetical protein